MAYNFEDVVDKLTFRQSKTSDLGIHDVPTEIHRLPQKHEARFDNVKVI